MPRDIPVGNGRLLICFDRDYQIRDLYFPHVGQENHLSGNICRFGVFVDDRFSWIGQEWKRELLYDEETLVTRVALYYSDLGLLITCRDAVDFHENIYLREIEIENLRPEKRQVRLFFSHDFNISGNSIGDTAAFDPTSGGIVHYKGFRYFLAGGMTEQAERLSQFAVGVKHVGGREGTYVDAEDGTLSGNAVAQGSVDSVIALHLDLDGHASKSAYYWICAAEGWKEVRRLDALVHHKHPRMLIGRTADYWRLWIRKESLPQGYLPPVVQRLYGLSTGQHK